MVYCYWWFVAGGVGIGRRGVDLFGCGVDGFVGVGCGVISECGL